MNEDGDTGSPGAGTQGAGGDPGQPGAGGAAKSAGKGPGGAAEQSGLLGAFYKVVLFAAAGKLFGGMPLALLPLIAAADFALGVITCMVIRKIPGVRILFGL